MSCSCNTDEDVQIRNAALAYAVEAYDSNEDPETLVSAAQTFYEFLTGKSR